MNPLYSAAICPAAPLLFSDSLICFCPLRIFEHAEYLLRPIGLYPGNSCLLLRNSEPSQLRCTPGYRHNDITVLIIGKPNTDGYNFLLQSPIVFPKSFGSTIFQHLRYQNPCSNTVVLVYAYSSPCVMDSSSVRARGL